MYTGGVRKHNLLGEGNTAKDKNDSYPYCLT